MRGRRSDYDYISQFIADCVQLGNDTPEKIVELARQKIQEIDEEIKKAEQKKIERAKILDVISTFDRSAKATKSEEARILSFFKIQHQEICKFICDNIRPGVVDIDNLSGKHSISDLMFCIKQLIEHKVIVKSGSHLLRGDAFEEYLKFVLREH
jgi:hypothetical protein